MGYRIGLTDRDAVTPRVDFQYQGSQYGSVFNDPLDQFASRTNINAYLSWNHANWQVQGYVTNLSNQVYPIAFNDQSAEIYDNPRQYGVQVRWSSK